MGNKTIRKTIGIKRIMRIMIVAFAFAAFAGGQAFAAEDRHDQNQGQITGRVVV